MAITKEKKKEISEKLEKAFKSAKSVVFVNFKGLKVNEETKLRHELRGQNIGYRVAKKTLVSRALDSVGFGGERPDLGAGLAVVWGDDVLSAHREIGNFALKNTEQMTIVGGVFDGEYVDAAKVTELATIPSRETLYAQFVNLINSPIQGFAMAVNEIAKKNS